MSFVEGVTNVVNFFGYRRMDFVLWIYESSRKHALDMIRLSHDAEFPHENFVL